MRTIYKYEVISGLGGNMDYETGIWTIKMPRGSKILCVNSQNDEPVMHCIVDTDRPMIERTFKLIGTGHEIPQTEGSMKGWDYVDTVFMHSGRLVWHIFENVVFTRWDD